MSPVLPSQVEELIISESDSFCQIFRKLLQSFYLTWLLVRYFFDDDGVITIESAVSQFGTDICNTVECAPVAEEGS